MDRAGQLLRQRLAKSGQDPVTAPDLAAVVVPAMDLPLDSVFPTTSLLRRRRQTRLKEESPRKGRPLGFLKRSFREMRLLE